MLHAERVFLQFTVMLHAERVFLQFTVMLHAERIFLQFTVMLNVSSCKFVPCWTSPCTVFVRAGFVPFPPMPNVPLCHFLPCRMLSLLCKQTGRTESSVMACNWQSGLASWVTCWPAGWILICITNRWILGGPFVIARAIQVVTSWKMKEMCKMFWRNVIRVTNCTGN
jgi:hypothetical protein